MTGTSEKELKLKRASLKGRLTTFEKYLSEFQSNITNTSINEIKTRLKKCESMLDEYDVIQSNIEILSNNSEVEIAERESTEDRYFKAIAEAQEFINKFKDNDSELESARSVIQNSNIKLPQIKIPNFDGDITKWTEFHDTYVSLIHDNATIATINKYHYLKCSLSGSAASVIASLEMSSRNYEVAWKLLCERYNDKRKLVSTHLKLLLNVSDVVKGASLRFLADHIAKHLRALGNLDENTENWDTIIIFLFSAKLDNSSNAKWEEYKNSLTQRPNLEQFYIFLRQRADILEATSSGSNSDNHPKYQHGQLPLYVPPFKRINKQQKEFVATASGSKQKHYYNCIVCNGDHEIFTCDKFLCMSPEDRFNFIIKHHHCINCLRSGHLVHECRARLCKHCFKKHNSLLHFDRTQAETKQLVTSPVSLSTCISNQILLSTAVVKVATNNSNKFIVARCLLDCGSQSSFISQDLFNKLSIEYDKVSAVCVTGINNISFETTRRCNIKVQSCTSKFSTTLSAFVINGITSALPCHKVDMSTINLPNNIILADPNFHAPSKVDILLGADIFWNILRSEQIRLGSNLPILHNSVFGWIISGPVMCYNDNNKNKNGVICNFSSEIKEQLSKFWQLEEVPTKTIISEEEECCEQHFVQHTRRLEDGRFCVSLPLKVQPEQLGDSYYIASKRLHTLERRFQKQPDVKRQYVNFLDEYEALGHLSKLNRPSNAVFLPHHPVLKEKSESTKCRVVFDASCKTSSGLSLNDIMMVGPTVQDDIFSILIRLREHRFIFTGDIEKMYRQILVEPSQRHLQSILWRKNESDPISYLQLNTVTYGISAAPFLSTRCIKQLALESKDSCIKNIILHDFYIDDLITGCGNESDLIDIYLGITKYLSSACFDLRKIKSNSRLLLNRISSEVSNESKQDNLKFSSITSTLGIEWNPNTDCILISILKSSKMYEGLNKFTKRNVLSISSSIFDPLGLLSVCIITCKMILQLLWLQKLEWDEKIPQNISSTWERFISNIKCIENLSIPRHAVCLNPINITLHTFSDASLKAYAACVYISSSDATGCINVRLLCAKSKVAPLKSTTIPRLELCGAVLASRLCKKVRESLRGTVHNQYFWSDSKVVLSWLKTPPHKLNAFVSHRVVEVNDNVPSEWLYVPSELNPADLAYRGVYPEEVEGLSLWWEGPVFLRESQDHWPDQGKVIVNIGLPEIHVHLCNLKMSQNSVFNFEKYSSFVRLRNIIAYVYRFFNNCKYKTDKRIGHFTVDELQHSELKLALLSQLESFQNCKNNFKHNPALYNLTPFVDDTGLIRVGGRLHNSEYNFDKKHPIVLDSKHHYCELIMRHFHIKLMHAGPQLLLSLIREYYWPIGGRVLARRVCRNCILCKRLKGVVAKQIMGNLPPQRLSPGFPFEITGTDYAGPFMIVNKKGRGAKLIKCYLCIFICFKIKAVHLELVSDLSTEAFILALRRFMSRRGKPTDIFCDNGTNFVGASREIAALVKNSCNAVSDLASEGIKFNFSPVNSPHFGGLYEAAVKSAKYHLKRAASNSHFTFEELQTLFTQIEAILNSRPLVPLSTDPNDLSPLTPGHFLIGRPLTSLPAPVFEDANPNRLHRYARIEQARQYFWNRWTQEYICGLQQKTKWQTKQPNIKTDQMVLIRDNFTPPMKWPLGRIVATHPGSDGRCRVADIKTSKGIIRRAIDRICPLFEASAAETVGT